MHAVVAVVALIVGWLLGASRNREEAARAPIIRFIVKHPWLTAAALTAVVVTGATLVVISGVMPVKASSGHWAITARLLDFAKVRSVATHSLGIQSPPLDDEALLLRGAGHYESGCYPCHGRPGAGVPPVMAAMTPDPPELMGTLSRYTPEQLFSIVKHGIKFTGMPAWPVQQRDDEVWAVVSFLRRMPALDATEYRRLAYGERGILPDAAPSVPTIGVQPPPRAVRDVCWRCHGVDGLGRGPGAFPSLAGQRAEYLHASLRAFADRRRFSGIMSPVAASLSDQAMREAAEYYAALPPREAERSGDSSTIERGALVAARGIPDKDIPACAECHGPTDAPKNPMYPRLAAQHPRYLTSQLDLLKARRRGGSPNVALMHAFVDRLSPAHIRDVTVYYGSIEATPPPRVSGPGRIGGL
jgi:cytochrome c553